MKIVKIIGFLFGGIIILGLIVFFLAKAMLNEKEPQGRIGVEADQLAEKMMASVDKMAWDSTRWVQWSFRGTHHFLWNKETHNVKVNWEENEVFLNSKDHTKGIAFEKGVQLTADKASKAVNKAWSFFCNDSFWLNPVIKAFDAGTERSIVDLEGGKQALKVQYKSGGVTPGDSYLWTLDEQHRPTSWQMWTKILPIDGFPIGWNGWKQVSTGAWISTTHTAFGKEGEMIGNLKAGMQLENLGIKENPFSVLK